MSKAVKIEWEVHASTPKGFVVRVLPNRAEARKYMQTVKSVRKAIDQSYGTKAGPVDLYKVTYATDVDTYRVLEKAR